MKSLAMSPQRKYPIPYQGITKLGTKIYKILSPQPAKYWTGYKALIHVAEEDCNNSTDTSCTNKEDSINNLKAINIKNMDDKNKNYN